MFIRYGLLEDKFRIKIVRAESLEIVDPFGLADPFVEVYFGDTLLGEHAYICVVLTVNSASSTHI
jgi:hypothetical protein